MQVNKQKVALAEAPMVEATYLNQTILIKPYLTRTDQSMLLSVYVEEYFNLDTNERVLDAEYALLLTIIELCTNIPITEEIDGKLTPLFTLDGLLSNYALIKMIRDKIVNYGEFRALLQKTVDEIKEQKRLDEGLGKSIVLFGDKLKETLEGFDFSPEKMENIRSLLKEVGESSVISNMSKTL